MILFDYRFVSNRPSGIGSYSKYLLKNISKTNEKILLIRKKGDPSLGENYSEFYTSLKAMSMFNSVLYLYIFLRYKGIEKVVYPHYSVPIGFIRLAGATIHDVFPLMGSSYFQKSAYLKRLHFVLWLRLLNLYSSEVTVVSLTTRNRLSRLGYYRLAELVKVIPPINLAGYVPCDFIKRPDENTYLYIGDCRLHKNIERVIDFVSARMGKLIILGPKDKFYKRIESYFESNSCVSHLGQVTNEEKEYYLRKSEFYICLSKDEGFGIPVFEARKFKCKLVLSDIEIFRELHSDYGAEWVQI